MLVRFSPAVHKRSCGREIFSKAHPGSTGLVVTLGIQLQSFCPSIQPHQEPWYPKIMSSNPALTRVRDEWAQATKCIGSSLIRLPQVRTDEKEIILVTWAPRASVPTVENHMGKQIHVGFPDEQGIIPGERVGWCLQLMALSYSTSGIYLPRRPHNSSLDTLVPAMVDEYCKFTFSDDSEFIFLMLTLFSLSNVFIMKYLVRIQKHRRNYNEYFYTDHFV